MIPPTYKELKDAYVDALKIINEMRKENDDLRRYH